MKTLTLNNGNTIPQFGLGTWKSEPGQVKNAVKYALSIGYQQIDSAPIYGNEKEVGEGLKESFGESVVKREDIFITSKLWNNRHYKKEVIPALKQTLQDLQLDYLDLYLIHWPVAFKPDVNFPEDASGLLSLSEVPLIETWQGMEQAVEEGLVKNIGVSNFSIKKLENIIANCNIKPSMNQVECHPYLQQDKLLTYCQKNDVAFTAYSPLGSKDRPDFVRNENEPILLENEVIKNIAQKHQATTAQVLIQWAIERETVVIPKSVSPERIKQNYEAQNISLDTEDMEQIKALNRDYRYVDASFFVFSNSSYTVESIWE